MFIIWLVAVFSLIFSALCFYTLGFTEGLVMSTLILLPGWLFYWLDNFPTKK